MEIFHTKPSAKKIIIIDRDPELVKRISQFLIRQGFDIVPCTEGRDAVTLIVREQYVDLLIVEYEITEIDFDVLKEIMAIVKREIPVIMICGRNIASEEDRKKYPFLLKPIDLQALLETVNNSVRRLGT